MKNTVYNSSFFRSLLSFIARFFLRLRGWEVIGAPPKEKKSVIISVPHETNWDFPLALSFAFVVGHKIYWMGKKSLFRWPFGGIMRWMGGIVVERSTKNNMVEQMVQAYKEREELCIVVPPEGTRSNVKRWKTGFYHIAVGAKVPIILGFIDYKNKKGGFGPTFYPTGDIDADFKEIRRFYQENGYLKVDRDS